MVKLRNINAEELQEKLYPFKIMIPNCANFCHLDASYVRIYVKNKNYLERLKYALNQLI
jgi:threonine-phosphate decarboxylase